jgi:hypothetical protein
MAAAEKNLRHYARVLDLVDRYLAEAGAALTEDDKVRAKALQDTVKGFVTNLTITVDQPGADVSLNGRAIGKSPVPAPLRTEMGDTKIEVKKTDFQPFVLNQSLPGGESVAIDVKLVPVVKEGSLRVVASHGDEIRIDGQVVGKGQWQGMLPAGTHSIEVTAEGKRPYRSDVVVETGQSAIANVSLEPIVKSSVAPQQDSGGVPAWVWIGGGVLLAGLGTTAAILAFGGEDEQGPTTPGSMGLATLGF